MKRQSGRNGVFDVGGFGISVRPDVEYFELNKVDSAQNWRRRWFYIRDEPGSGQQYGLEPFLAKSEVVKKRAWKNMLDDVEAAEAAKLMERLRVVGKEVSGIQIIRTFIQHRIHPLQVRAHDRCMYQGVADPTRVSK